MQTEVGKIKIGVLSLQGGVEEHLHHLRVLGCDTIEIKKPCQLDSIQGLILPGGESTTIGKLMKITGLFEKLKLKINEGLPVWGTCAGMILLAKNLYNDPTKHLEVLDIEVKRNGYGRQLDSFTTSKIIPKINKTEPVSMVFIRAPYITKILSSNVEILCEIDNKIVAVKEGNIIASSFHPELTSDLKFHKYFISICEDYFT